MLFSWLFYDWVPVFWYKNWFSSTKGFYWAKICVNRQVGVATYHILVIICLDLDVRELVLTWIEQNSRFYFALSMCQCRRQYCMKSYYRRWVLCRFSDHESSALGFIACVFNICGRYHTWRRRYTFLSSSFLVILILIELNETVN